MKKILAIIVFAFGASLHAIAQPAGMEVGEVMIVNPVTLKEAAPGTMKTMLVVAPAWKKEGISVGFYEADRGRKKGEWMRVCMVSRASSAPAGGSPFPGEDGKKFTKYQLIGADKIGTKPVSGLLGLHFIQVKPEKTAEFEKFVVEKLHPAVGQLFPDMQMLYYKATAGERTGSYLTLWTIKSVAARDNYWPLGKPETELLKSGYVPLTGLAKELEPYLVEGSYLEPGKGVAAIFESKEWTDYVLK